MKYKFGDLVHYKPFYIEPNCPCALEVIKFDEKKQKYIYLELNDVFLGEELTLCRFGENDLEYLSAIDGVNDYLVNAEVFLTSPEDIDLFCYPLYDYVGKEEIKVRLGVRRLTASFQKVRKKK